MTRSNFILMLPLETSLFPLLKTSQPAKTKKTVAVDPEKNYIQVVDH